MSEAGAYHRPVLLAEVVAALQPQLGGLFIDCTLGLGGHSEALLAANPNVRLLAIDRDEIALNLAITRLAAYQDRFQAVLADYRELSSILAERGLADRPAQGILADFGVSSLQLDTAERGFSFQQSGPLDMRMDRRQPGTAAELVNSLPETELADLIYQFGEEPASRAIARRIVNERARQPIETTDQLARVVAAAVTARSRGRGRGHQRERIHPATRTFQALRIAVNEELTGLTEFVHDAVAALAPSGRLAIITFHSLEDRLIKNAYRFEAGECRCPPALPQCVCGARAIVRIITKKPIVANDHEVTENPRARSAKLRVCEKIS